MIGMYVSSKSLTLVATYCHMSIRVYGLLYAAALSWVHILASCRSYRDLWPVASSWCPWFQCSWAVAANSTCTRKRGKTISLFPLLLLLICFLTNTQPSTVRKVLLDASHFKWIACVFLFLLQHQNCCISQKEAPERFVAHHTHQTGSHHLPHSLLDSCQRLEKNSKSHSIVTNCVFHADCNQGELWI